jgi:hypothetical protein
MQQYVSQVTIRFALLSQVLPRTATFTQEQVLGRLAKMEQQPKLARLYPDQLQGVLGELDYIKKNSKQQAARLYICHVVFEKTQLGLVHKRVEVQEDAAKYEQFLQELRPTALFLAQSGSIEARLQERQGMLKMLDVFEERVKRSHRALQELEVLSNQLVFNSEQASVIIFKAMDMNMPTEAVQGMVQELEEIALKVDTFKMQVDKLEEQANQVLAEASRLSLPVGTIL